ncbi:MAG TPA: patatin-like phospholipase family protein [Cyclobacteriaceae bacterium]|nr:patatin-like phospholipase family protein [Cyclobacteriaceae bacterium]
MNPFVDELQKTDIPNRIKGLETKVFSDVIDIEGYQYVDLILEGPGNASIALCGYTYVLEQCGIRFFNLAGSSSGALNAVMLAALQEGYSTKSEKLASILYKTDLSTWQDNDRYIKWLLNKLSSNAKMKSLFLLLSIGDLLKILNKKHGLSSTANLEKWLSKELNKLGINTISDLEIRRKRLAEDLRLRSGENYLFEKAQLSIIAADITTRTKAIFPKMASLYWQDPDLMKPSQIICAAMATPYLFYPYEIKPIPAAQHNGKLFIDSNINITERISQQEFQETLPDKFRFVDAGVFSNFPANHFHRKDGLLPRKPSFGVRTSVSSGKHNDKSDIADYCINITDTFREINDQEFLHRNPDYEQLITKINPPKDLHTFEFNLTESQKAALFLAGAKAAINFLERFNWGLYKDTRSITLSRINPLAYMNGVDVFRLYNIPN